MSSRKEFSNRVFSLSPLFSYLPDEDRYVFALDAPKHKFNIIGAGVNGQEHIRIAHLEGRAGVYGVYDPNLRSVEAAQRTHGQFSQQPLVVYDSLEAACEDPEVDGLIISTPNYTHIDVIRVAAESGKHILLEKPMATTIHDAYEITQIAENYEAVLQIGLQYRYKAIYVEAIHEALERAALGNIKTISILEHRFPFLDKVKQWNKFSKYSGGTLVEKCCHYFDLLNLFAQARPVSVYATGGMAVNFLDFEYEGEKSDILDNAFVLVTYANGVQARFDLCMFAPMLYEELILCGDAGRLKASEQTDFLPAPRATTHLEVACGDKSTSRIATPCYPTFIEESGHNGATYFEQVNFIDNIEGRGETHTASALEGLWAIVVGVAAEAAVKSGKLVFIDELLAENGIEL